MGNSDWNAKEQIGLVKNLFGDRSEGYKSERGSLTHIGKIYEGNAWSHEGIEAYVQALESNLRKHNTDESKKLLSENLANFYEQLIKIENQSESYPLHDDLVSAANDNIQKMNVAMIAQRGALVNKNLAANASEFIRTYSNEVTANNKVGILLKAALLKVNNDVKLSKALQQVLEYANHIIERGVPSDSSRDGVVLAVGAFCKAVSEGNMVEGYKHSIIKLEAAKLAQNFSNYSGKEFVTNSLNSAIAAASTIDQCEAMIVLMTHCNNTMRIVEGAENLHGTMAKVVRNFAKGVENLAPDVSWADVLNDCIERVNHVFGVQIEMARYERVKNELLDAAKDSTAVIQMVKAIDNIKLNELDLGRDRTTWLFETCVDILNEKVGVPEEREHVVIGALERYSNPFRVIPSDNMTPEQFNSVSNEAAHIVHEYLDMMMGHIGIRQASNVEGVDKIAGDKQSQEELNESFVADAALEMTQTISEAYSKLREAGPDAAEKYSDRISDILNEAKGLFASKGASVSDTTASVEGDSPKPDSSETISPENSQDTDTDTDTGAGIKPNKK